MQIYCCECKSDMQTNLINGVIAYPHRPDLANLPFWQCPKCNNFVGCHHKTNQPTRPLGVIPNFEIKQARQKLHALIDPVWKNKLISRTELYKLISKQLGYQFHIAEIKSMDEVDSITNIILPILKDIK